MKFKIISLGNYHHDLYFKIHNGQYAKRCGDYFRPSLRARMEIMSALVALPVRTKRGFQGRGCMGEIIPEDYPSRD